MAEAAMQGADLLSRCDRALFFSEALHGIFMLSLSDTRSHTDGHPFGALKGSVGTGAVWPLDDHAIFLGFIRILYHKT